jgi:hypothetical protein
MHSRIAYTRALKDNAQLAWAQEEQEKMSLLLLKFEYGLPLGPFPVLDK